MATYRFTTELWLYEGDAAWHFVTLPPDVSDDIEACTAHVFRRAEQLTVGDDVSIALDLVDDA